MSSLRYITRLRDEIRRFHGVESFHVRTVPVTESSQGKIVWDGEVEVFGVQGHPKARWCYAWAYKNDQGREHYTAVLHVPPVDSSQAAVKAALASQVKNENKET